MLLDETSCLLRHYFPWLSLGQCSFYPLSTFYKYLKLYWVQIITESKASAYNALEAYKS